MEKPQGKSLGIEFRGGIEAAVARLPAARIRAHYHVQLTTGIYKRYLAWANRERHVPFFLLLMKQQGGQ